MILRLGALFSKEDDKFEASQPIYAFDMIGNTISPRYQSREALDVFYDSMGLASENMNFAWSKILSTHKNSTIGKIDEKLDEFEVKCSTEGRLERVRRDNSQGQ